MKKCLRGPSAAERARDREAYTRLTIDIPSLQSSKRNLAALERVVPQFVGSVLSRYPEITVEGWDWLFTTDGEYSGQAVLVVSGANETTIRRLEQMWRMEFRPSP